MIDERHEELASLYAFDLLEGGEREQFEATLARDPELQALVRQLRDTAASLAHTAPEAEPPADLKRRVLATIAGSSRASRSAEIIRPPATIWRVLPWAAAACFAVVAGLLGMRQLTTRTELATLRTRQELTDLSLRSAQQELEAERILKQRQLQDAAQQLAGANTQLGTSRTQLEERDRLLAEARNQLADRERLLAEGRTQLTEVRSQLGERDRQVATLTQRVEALARSSAEVGQQLGESRQQVAKLSDELKSQAAVSELKITALASMLKNSPQALAVAVWDPKKQEGVLNVQNLPALAANEDYQLWVVDPQYPNPVDGGVFTVDRSTGVARVSFKARQPVGAINAFAVTRERKGGVPKAEGPFVLLGK